MAATEGQDTLPRWFCFPEPKAAVHALAPSDVAQLLESHAFSSNRSFLLVDVRHTDWEGGTIASSINLPAHTVYQTRPVIYQLCKQAGIKTIIFYCGKKPVPVWSAHACCAHGIKNLRRKSEPLAMTGSSNGRGPRCAGWMQDYFNEIGEASMSSAILKGGIKGWQKEYRGKMMEWYDEKFWTQQNL